VDQKIDVASNEKKVIKADVKKGIVEQDENEVVSYVAQLDAPPCKECGTIMIRSGSCYKCPNCSFSSGCS
jgi:tRNA(Ile2) C34 agmatinyltransferase TiaS